MRTYRFKMGVLTALLACGMGPRVYADGLAQQITSLFGPGGFRLDRDSFHATHYAIDSQATTSLLSAQVQQFASAAADFPAVSTVPGLTYRYNTELQAFERSSGSLGPVYVERPQTIGRGKLDVGFSYLFQDFDKLDGNSLDGLSFNLRHNDCCGPPGVSPIPDGLLGGTPQTAFELDTVDLFFDEFRLKSHVLSLYGTYGITDRWDVKRVATDHLYVLGRERPRGDQQ